MRKAEVSLQIFEDAVAAFKDTSKDELTRESGIQAGKRLDSLVKTFNRPKEVEAILKMYRGPAGIADEAAAVHVARNHGQRKVVDYFYEALRSVRADDIITCIEQCITTCKARTARASLVPDAPDSDDETTHAAVAPEASTEHDDDDDRLGVNPDLDLDNPEAPSGGED